MLFVIVVVLAVAAGLSISGLAAVGLSVPLLCGGYLLLAGRKSAWQVVNGTFDSFCRLADEMIVVVGATVLGIVIGSLPEVSALAASITPSVVSGAPLIAAQMLVIIAGGVLGLHPMIGATVLIPLLATGGFGVDPRVVAATGVFAWGLSATISIWTLPVAAASSIFRVPLRTLCTGRVLRFSALYVVAVIVYLGGANALLSD